MLLHPKNLSSEPKRITRELTAEEEKEAFLYTSKVFASKIINRETEKAIEEVEKGKVTRAKNVDDLFRRLQK